MSNEAFAQYFPCGAVFFYAVQGGYIVHGGLTVDEILKCGHTNESF